MAAPLRAVLQKALRRMKYNSTSVSSITDIFFTLLKKKKKERKCKAYARFLLLHLKKNRTRINAQDIENALFPTFKISKPSVVKSKLLCKEHKCEVWFQPSGGGGRAGGAKATPGGSVRVCRLKGLACSSL